MFSISAKWAKIILEGSGGKAGPYSLAANFLQKLGSSLHRAFAKLECPLDGSNTLDCAGKHRVVGVWHRGCILWDKDI